MDKSVYFWVSIGLKALLEVAVVRLRVNSFLVKRNKEAHISAVVSNLESTGRALYHPIVFYDVYQAIA